MLCSAACLDSLPRRTLGLPHSARDHRNFCDHIRSSIFIAVAFAHHFLAADHQSCGHRYMKRLRLDRWASQLQHPPRNPRLPSHSQRCPISHEARARPQREEQHRVDHFHTPLGTQRRGAASRRKASSAAAAQVEEEEPSGEALESDIDAVPTADQLSWGDRTSNAPSHTRARQSAKLSALHARLALPAKLPLQTLARCLIDQSVDSRPGYNNAPLALLGQDLLGYYTSEHLICHYPRLPMPILFAAQYAYVGPATLAAMRAEWGVEVVAAPGPEVDPGLLQLQRTTPGNAMAEDGKRRLKDMPQAGQLKQTRRNEQYNYRRGMSSRIVFDDQFGDLQYRMGPNPDETAPFQDAPISTSGTDAAPAQSGSDSVLPLSHIIGQPAPEPIADATTVSTASASFVRALAGALYLHVGTPATKAFHRAHILSRRLALHTLFNFTHPTRDLSFLCKREGLEPPVARLLSETGRLSRTPVFVVGVFSGDEKLGEGAGASLNEARVRAAAAALRAWYLYSPLDEHVMLPSEVEDGVKGTREWKPQMVDVGEIVT